MEEEICRIVWRGKALKGLLFGRKQNAGRNNKGRIVINYRGGGEKKNYRLIDFKRLKINIPGRVCRIERDIHRTALIMLISYYDGTLSYILKPERIKLGDVICATFYKLEGKGLKIGNHLKIGLIPLGYYIHNIELGEGRGGKLVRSQGVAGKIVKRYKNYTVVKLPSNKYKVILSECYSTLGKIGLNKGIKKKKKAGENRLRGKRPRVRGVAMNPIDHPHGGGEGKTAGGRCSVSKWGWLTKVKKKVR